MRDNISEYGPGPGRPKGSQNLITLKIKEAFANTLDNMLPDLERWIRQTAQDNPEKAAELLIKISERFVPKLNQTAITDAEGGTLNVEFKFGKKDDIEPTDFNLEEV
jgi:hypothetical protein